MKQNTVKQSKNELFDGVTLQNNVNYSFLRCFVMLHRQITHFYFV